MAVGMGEKMEELKSSRIRKISVIRVCSEEFIRVCRILEAQVGCEIPEATFMFPLAATRTMTGHVQYHNGYA